MSQADLRRVLIEAPAVDTDRRYGLYSVTSPQGLAPHENFGVEYEPELCLLPGSFDAAICEDGQVEKTANVDFDARAYGDPFVIYAAADCKPVGRSLAAIQERVTRTLTLGEEAAVERQLWPLLAVDAVDVTGGVGAVPVLEGLKRLEKALASYGIRGTIFAPRELSVDMSNDSVLWERTTGELETPVGTRLAFIDYDQTYGPTDGSGEEPVPAPAGTSWMYATGPVTVRRGDVLDYPASASMVRSTETGAYTNDTFVMVERVIVPTVDCIRYAVLVDNDIEGVS